MRALRVSLLLLATTSAATASAQECSAEKQPGLERYLRQLHLDLLGRPPTPEDYAQAQAKGRVDVDDIRALMSREEFYERMRGYHRSLLRSNISAVVFNNNSSRLNGTGDAGRPYSFDDDTVRAIRGRGGEQCDPATMQAACKSYSQDPHAQGPAEKECYDESGIPLPVSSDYNVDYFQCRALTDAGNPASCEIALDAGNIPEKYRYFCDNRRQGNGQLRPFLCIPDPTKAPTLYYTEEILEADGGGHIVAFEPPDAGYGIPGLTYARLNRCTTGLQLQNGIKGNYVNQLGCVQREGVEVAPPPFWETQGRSEVLVCAIEAQNRPQNPVTLQSCEGTRFISDRSCGCGLNMRRCESATRALVHDVRLAAFNAEPERIADSVLRRDEPYFNLLTTRRSFVNGPLSQFYRENHGAGVFTVSLPVGREAIPDMSYADRGEWVEYLRGGQHSGVLTTPSFLLRFPTQRARVNHFYEAFLCKTFVPAEGASLPDPEDSCNRENNLAKRCGCNYCHATIEPTGAHWGRFGERSAEYLAPELFPRFNPVCEDCAIAGNCNAECSTNYVTVAYDGDGANDLGKLKTYLYRTEPEEVNIEAGPALLVQRMLQTGDLERCTVKRIWNEFLGRPMTMEEQGLYLEDLSRGFSGSQHNLKGLIERVVTSEAYRRID